MLVTEVSRFGGPEVLTPRRAPDPVAGPGQVVVRTAAADVLLVDTMIRAGRGVDYFPIKPPYVPGNGIAGLVISAGRGVEPSWIGRAVVAHTGGSGGRGGYAERAVVPAADLIPVPSGLRLADAAALLHDGSTAFMLIARVRIRPADWVLVTAAGGGMGVLLVQLARALGGRVIGAARGPAKLDLARNAGARAAVDYSEPGWTEEVRELTAGLGPDVVFDGTGGGLGRAAFEVTARGGEFSAHGTTDGYFTRIDPAEAARREITVHRLGDHDPVAFRAHATTALAVAAAGRVRPVIGQTFPLDRAVEAHAAIEARATLAKTLLFTDHITA
jgi:NADPH:quinone reductase